MTSHDKPRDRGSCDSSFESSGHVPNLLFREIKVGAKISSVFRSDQPFKSYEQKTIIFLKNFLKNPYVNFSSKLLISRDIDHLEGYKLHRCNQLVKARRMVPILTVLDQGIRYLKIRPKNVSN